MKTKLFIRKQENQQQYNPITNVSAVYTTNVLNYKQLCVTVNQFCLSWRK